MRVAPSCEVQGSPRGFLVVVWIGLYCDGVGGDERFIQSLELRMEAPPRSGRYEGVGVCVRVVAEVPRPLLLLRVPCFPVGVGDVEMVAPPTDAGFFECGCLRCLLGLGFGLVFGRGG